MTGFAGQTARADLKNAMQAKASDEVRVLRTLIAALDNAEAVPGGDGPYVARAFGAFSSAVLTMFSGLPGNS